MNVWFIHVNIYNNPYKKKERTEMEKFTLNYSLKNIPYQYDLFKLIEKIEF